MNKCRWLVCIAPLLAGCKAQNVLFSSRPEQPPAIAVYIDRYGDIYPGQDVPLDLKFLKTKRDSTQLEFRLSTYYRDAFVNRSRTPVWNALARDAGIGPLGPEVTDSTAWIIVQDALRTRLVNRLRAATAAEGKTLVILLHGFNNDTTGAREWYDPLSVEIGKLVRDPVFFRVHWDGLTQNNIPLGIWPPAQYNFPLIGLEFRRVLNQLDRGKPLRVFAHSSGAPMMASVIGDASWPFYKAENEPEFRRYRALAKLDTGVYARRFPTDFRIGFVAPAMSPNTFEYFKGDPGVPPVHIIFGLNSEDEAVSKAVMPCTFMGSTCLGSVPQLFCDVVVSDLQGSPQVKLSMFNFAHSPGSPRSFGFWDSHKVLAYMAREDMPHFLDLLFADKPTATDERAKYCGG